MKTDIDTAPIKELESILEDISDIAMPIAVQRTLNDTAYKAMQQGKSNADTMFTLRNTWTKRSIGYDKTQRTLDVDKMKSHMGSKSDYMRHQEIGGKSYDNIDGTTKALIPTAGASGQTGSRTKPVRKTNYKDRIKSAITKQRQRKPRIVSRFKTKSQQRVAALIEAKRNKDMFFYDESNKSIFKMTGRISKRGGYPSSLILKRVYAVEDTAIRYKATKWMEKTVDDAKKDIGTTYRANLVKQIEFLKRKKRRVK